MKKTYDLIIQNGRILDGAGNPPFFADIGIAEGKITGLQPRISPGAGRRIMNVEGLTVAPGFIDTHAHDDIAVLKHPAMPEKSRQGITTVINGNCGISAAPTFPRYEMDLKGLFGLFGPSPAPGGAGFPNFTSYFRAVAEAGPAVNVGMLAGHLSIRTAVMGAKDESVNASGLTAMRALLTEAMKAGCLGFSTGLIYAPGSFADTDEIVSLAETAAAFGGVYTTHMRSEGKSIFTALDEAIDIGRRAGLPVIISHLKMADRSVWGRAAEVLSRLRLARSGGLDIAADQYPYTAGSTTLSAVLPRSIMAPGLEAVRKRLHDPDYRNGVIEAIRGDDADRWNTLIEGGSVVIANSKTKPRWIGKPLSQIAEEAETTPLDAALDLIAAEGSAAAMILFSMDEADIETILQAPFVMIGTDGIAGGGGSPHPRLTSAFPRILGHYVKKGILTLPDAVRKMTSLPALTFRLFTKGLIRPGMDADLTIFDTDEVCDRGTYADPLTPPGGILHVIVGGEPAVESGAVTGNGKGAVIGPA